jgi:adenine-specific DNA-methyltransferase
MRKSTNDLTQEKAHGRVYTPLFIVRNILDLSGYTGSGVLRRHIIDNSCGDGAFLTEVVSRYCEVAVKSGMTADCLASELQTYIHGIEIDAEECEKCRANVSKIAAKYGVDNVTWDIICDDALAVRKYDGKMDFVVGNPPYVRIHNLMDNYAAIKRFRFAQDGMTDLFIVFYEIGLNMLNERGILGYISPSSIFNSVAGTSIRRHLVFNRGICKIVDLKHFQPFEATTYTAILILAKECNSGSVEYYEYDEANLAPRFIDNLRYEDFFFGNAFFFGESAQLLGLRQIMSNDAANSSFAVKNGFATLCDDFFIGDWTFEDYTIQVIKASTGRSARCLFPYDEHGQLVPYETLVRCPKIRMHYETRGEKLRARSLEKDSSWYGFGRSQGINDVPRRKYAVNALIRNKDDIKLSCCEAGVGVYSGLYILTCLSLKELRSILVTDDFTSYVSMLGKYKSGGYYTYSSKDLQRYLNYKISERSGFKNGQLCLL